MIKIKLVINRKTESRNDFTQFNPKKYLFFIKKIIKFHIIETVATLDFILKRFYNHFYHQRNSPYKVCM